MRISAAIRDYLIEIEVRKYTPKTIKGYRTNLGLFLRFCEEVAEIDTLEDLTPAIVRQFAKHMVLEAQRGNSTPAQYTKRAGKSKNGFFVAKNYEWWW